MTLLYIAEGLFVGGATGFISGLLGVGGGFILVPLLTLVGVPIHTAVGTSMAFIVCASMAGLVQHVRQGSIDPVVAMILALPAAVTAWVGAQFSALLPASTLHLAFGVLLFAVLTFFRLAPLQRLAKVPTPPATHHALPYVLHRQRVVADRPYTYNINVVLAALSGAGTGMIAGFFGVSGGFLLVPTLVLVFRIPLQVTVGSCLAINILPALVATVTHWQLGNVDGGLWLPLAAAGIVCSQVGARYMLKLPSEVLRNFFQGLVLAAALFMLGRGLLG
jgi:uncharacterized membrane protein YfcA